MSTPHRRKKTITAPKDSDLIFVFERCAMCVSCNEEVFSPEEIEYIKWCVTRLSQHIEIDKSYVEYEGTKFEKTFIAEHGWNDLCQMVLKINSRRKTTEYEKAVILESYKFFITCYIYQCLDDLGINIDAVYIEMKADSKFRAEVRIDDIKAWKRYPGKWQTW